MKAVPKVTTQKKSMRAAIGNKEKLSHAPLLAAEDLTCQVTKWSLCQVRIDTDSIFKYRIKVQMVSRYAFASEKNLVSASPSPFLISALTCTSRSM